MADWKFSLTTALIDISHLNTFCFSQVSDMICFAVSFISNKNPYLQ